MSSSIKSTEYVESSHFSAFNDSDDSDHVSVDFDAGGIDTREIDSFRQGVEITTNKHRFSGMQPKIWTGNVNHFTKAFPYGQARDFTEYGDSNKFLELPKFDPVSYIVLGFSYPFPIIFNDGPQQQEEAYVEPLTIPFRKNSNEGKYIAHRIHATLEDGNNFQDFNNSSNMVKQFIPYKNDEIRFFLDEGGSYYGDGSIENKIITPQYSSTTEGSQELFNDNITEIIENSINSTDQDLIDILIEMNQNVDNGLLPNDSKSSNAGFFIYGGNSAKYGTDSITYLGRFRGI